MLREATLKMPSHDNDGNLLNDLKVKLEKNILDIFGGFSLQRTESVWLDAATGKVYNEPILTYVIAMEQGADNDLKLTGLADLVKLEGKQEAVYVRFADGNVQLI